MLLYPAGFALQRYRRFRGRALFGMLATAPLVMPEVITGLSLLLLFVTIAVDRGFWTVAIAHTTMAMCFVTVIVQSRLSDFDTSLEEAASDLGASPSRTTTTALTTSPQRSSGTPNTPASRTSGWLSSTLSTSAGATFSPPLTIVSALRPRTNR